MGNTTMMIILGVVILLVIVFVIVTTITGKKAAKKEKQKRYREVREKIKSYLMKKENQKNIRIEFEKVYARKGAEYKYRDVFDVIVQVIEPKTNKISEHRAFEIEGITTKIDKKNYKTDWVVNTSLDLDETKTRIAISEKEIKLTREEKKNLKKQEKLKEQQMLENEREQNSLDKKANKENKKDPFALRNKNQNVEKFVPKRKKEIN